MRLLLFLYCSVFSLLACQKKTNTLATETRSFYMGVTPWPADFTINDVDSAYGFINSNCDIVSHHFDEGIPYEEAYYNRVMPTPLLQDMQTRKTKTAAGKKIFLSVSALGLSRTARAAYYANASANDSIKNYWTQLAFDDPKVVTAYVQYVSWLINQLQPVYVNYAVESNSALWSSAAFVQYKKFIAQVYAQLKINYPTIPFFISYMVDESSEGYTNASQLINYTDFIGLSAYPYVTISSSLNGNTNPAYFPPNYFDRFTDLAATKPLAFAETGYIAEDVMISSFSLNKQGTAEWQQNYLETVLAYCERHRAKLFIWFCYKDYDAGNNTLKTLGLYQDLFGLWEDTGFKNEKGVQRPAFTSWTKWMQKRKVD